MSTDTAIALIIVAFIGGCTVSFQKLGDQGIMKACLESNMEWKSGDCVFPPIQKPKGETE